MKVCIIEASGKLGTYQGRNTVIPGATNDRQVIQPAVDRL